MSADAITAKVAASDAAVAISDDEGHVYRLEPSGDTFRMTKDSSVHGGFLRRVVAKTAAYTCTVGDCGTIFTNRGDGDAITFTLPAAADSAGVWYEFIAVADYAMTIAGTAGELVTFNDAAANSVAYSTGSEIIGGALRAVCDGTSWLIFLMTNETQTPTVAT